MAQGAPSGPGVGLRSYGWLKVPHLDQVWASGAMGGSRFPIWTRCGPQELWVAQGAPSGPGVGLRSNGWFNVAHLNQVWASGVVRGSRCPIWTRCGPQELWVTQGALSEPGVGLRRRGWLKVPHLHSHVFITPHSIHRNSIQNLKLLLLET